MKRRLILSIVFLVLFAPGLPALDDGLARTPPMGWNSWNKIGCNVNEDAVCKAADSMVKTGTKALADYVHSVGFSTRMPGGRRAPGGQAAAGTSFRMPGSTRLGAWTT